MSLSQYLTSCGKSLSKVMTHSLTDLINICSVYKQFCAGLSTVVNKTDMVPYIKEFTVKQVRDVQCNPTARVSWKINANKKQATEYVYTARGALRWDQTPPNLKSSSICNKSRFEECLAAYQVEKMGVWDSPSTSAKQRAMKKHDLEKTVPGNSAQLAGTCMVENYRRDDGF